MALRIMKLAMEINTTVNVTPTVDRFFFNTASELVGPTTLTIAVGDFTDDTGAVATELPALLNNNSYFNVYVNGVLQMQDLSAYTAGTSPTGKLDFTIPAGETLIVDTPFVLQVVNYSPTANSTTET